MGRVIARLVKERDTARDQLSELQEQVQLAQQQGEMEVEAQPTGGLPAQTIEGIKQVQDQLTKLRKRMRKDANFFNDFSSFEQMSNFSIDDRSYPMHGTSKKKGITCLEVDSTSTYIVTGGVDGQVNIFDRN